MPCISFICDAGNVHLSYLQSGCVAEYIHVRCEVINSLRQVWRLSDVEVFRLGPNSESNVFDTNGFLYFFSESVLVNKTPSRTSFVSHLWFNSSFMAKNMTVTCESAEDIVLVENYGNQYE